MVVSVNLQVNKEIIGTLVCTRDHFSTHVSVVLSASFFLFQAVVYIRRTSTLHFEIHTMHTKITQLTH